MCRLITEPRIRVRNGVLLTEPGAQIDQPAAITAERAMGEFIRPGDLALAGRAAHAWGHDLRCSRSV